MNKNNNNGNDNDNKKRKKCFKHSITYGQSKQNYLNAICVHSMKCQILMQMLKAIIEAAQKKMLKKKNQRRRSLVNRHTDGHTVLLQWNNSTNKTTKKQKKKTTKSQLQNKSRKKKSNKVNIVEPTETRITTTLTTTTTATIIATTKITMDFFSIKIYSFNKQERKLQSVNNEYFNALHGIYNSLEMLKDFLKKFKRK